MSEVAYADFGSPGGNYTNWRFTQELNSMDRLCSRSQLQLGPVLENLTRVVTGPRPTRLTTLSNSSGTSVAGAGPSCPGGCLRQHAGRAGSLQGHPGRGVSQVPAVHRVAWCGVARDRPPGGVAEDCLPDTARKYTFHPT